MANAGLIAVLVRCEGRAQTGTARQAEVTVVSPEPFIIPGPAVNLSAEWSPIPDGLEVTSVAFDRTLTRVGDSGEAATQWVAIPGAGGLVPAWAWGAPNQQRFAACDFTDTPAGCNNGATILPPANTMDRWRGRPVLAADRLGRVVYVALYDTDGDDAAEGVAAAVSDDGGKTYRGVGSIPERAYDLTEAKAGEDCEKGEQDMPHASFDYTTKPPTLRVVWRHKSGGSFGGCIRSFRFDFTASPPALVPVTQAFKIENMERQGGSLGAGGQGAIKVRGADGVVTVVYQNDDIPNVCPNQNTKTVGWGSVVSFDEGEDWTDSEEIARTDTFQWCTLSSLLSDGGIRGVQRGIGEWDFILGNDGNAYVAVNDDDRHISLFMSPTRGVKLGGGSKKKKVWRRYCASDPFSPWLDEHPGQKGSLVCPGATPFGGYAGDNPPPPILFRPALTQNGAGEVGMLYYESIANTGSVHAVFRGNVVPRAWGFSNYADLAQNDAGIFQTRSLDAGGPRLSCDFPVPTVFNTFSLGATLGLTVQGKVEPLCHSGAVDFLPYWLAQCDPLASTVPGIEHPDLDLTPP